MEFHKRCKRRRSNPCYSTGTPASASIWAVVGNARDSLKVAPDHVVQHWRRIFLRREKDKVEINECIVDGSSQGL